jgi:hypothetical protein
MGDVIQFPLRKLSGAKLMRRADARIRREREKSFDEAAFGPPSSDKPAFTKKQSPDVVFYYIAQHLAAIESGASNDISLFGRALMIAHAQSRSGLIALSKYIAMRFANAASCGSSYLPEVISGKPWEQVFFRSLAAQLQRMGSEFPAASKKKKG